MLSLVTVSPVITAFRSCLSHHVFDQVNLWPACVGFETAIFELWRLNASIKAYSVRPIYQGLTYWIFRKNIYIYTCQCIIIILARELKKLRNVKVIVIRIVVGSQRVGKQTWSIGSLKKNRDHTDQCFLR